MDSYLNKLTTYNLQLTTKLEKEELASLIYHGIFDYPLTLAELIRWRAGNLAVNHQLLTINYKNGFYFLGGNEGTIYKRLLRKRISGRKFEIAKRAGKILGLIPSIKMVAVTGALAMENAPEEGDIDLMVVARRGTLWASRLVALLLLDFFRIPRRRFGDKNQKDKICMNMWLDEEDLILRKRNIYTAHEIAQIVPLTNKDDTYEKFLYKNRWILDFWPNSVKIKKLNIKNQNYRVKLKNPMRFALRFYILIFDLLISTIEKVAFNLQFIYMKRKVTKEVVTPTRALFHPVDWSNIVLSRLPLDNKKSSY